MIARNFRDNRPNSSIIAKRSEYRPMEKTPKKLLEKVRDIIRVKHYSYKTEKSYISWIKRYILFHDKRHPREMGGKEIEEFLTYLAIEENVAASTQNQALSAILFLYKEVLRQDLDLQVDAVRAKRSRYVPTFLTREEVLLIINHSDISYSATPVFLNEQPTKQSKLIAINCETLMNIISLDYLQNSV
jgi:site-specific recombinase XerD